MVHNNENWLKFQVKLSDSWRANQRTKTNENQDGVKSRPFSVYVHSFWLKKLSIQESMFTVQDKLNYRCITRVIGDKLCRMNGAVINE